VVLFPQSVASLPLNENGCFDWYGYTGSDYASNIGLQTSAVKQILEVIMSSKSGKKL
jgi:hypothetical protein